MKSRFFLGTALSLVAGVAIVGVLSLHGGIFDRSTVINPGNLYPVLNFDNHGNGVYTFTARLADGYVYVTGPFCDSPGWTLSGETATLVYDSGLGGNLASYFPVNIYGSFMPVGPGTKPPPIWNYNAEGRLTDYDYDVSPDYAQVDLDAVDPTAEFHSTLADIPCPSDWTATLTSGPGQWSQTRTGEESFVVKPEQPGEYEIKGEYEDQYDTVRLDAFRLKCKFEPNVIAVGKTAPVEFSLEGPEGAHKLYTFSIDPAANATMRNGPALDLDTRKHDLLVEGKAASSFVESTNIRNDQNSNKDDFTVVDMKPYLFEDFVIVDHPEEETVFVKFRPITMDKGTFTATLKAPGNGVMTAEDDNQKILTPKESLVYNLNQGDEIPLWFDIKSKGNAGGVATFSFVYDGGAEYAKLEKTLDVDVYKLTFEPSPINLYVGEEKKVKAKLEGPPKALGMLYTTEDCQHVVPVAMQVAHQAGAEVEVKIVGIKPSDEEPDDCALYGYFPDNRAMFAKIKVKSIKLDLEMERVSEDEEESPGGFVMVNDDDDNGDLNVDREIRYETGEDAENDLRKIIIHHGHLPEISQNYPLILNLHPLTADAKVWRNHNRSGSPLLYLGKTTVRFESEAEIPNVVWFEGVSPIVCGLKLSYYHPDTKELKDEIKITCVRVNIRLDGLSDEKIVRAGGNIVRIEPYEFSTGASLPVNCDRSVGNLKKLTLYKPVAGEYAGRHIRIDWPMDKVELYPEADFRSGVLVSPLAVPVASFPANGRLYYYANSVVQSDSVRDILIHARMDTPDPAGIFAEDKIRATNILLDLDVDSNNDGIVQADDPEEDKIEYVPFDRNPGKIVMLNDGDEDADGIPDFADFEITAQGHAPPRFAEVHCRLKSPFADELRLKLLYSGSDPAKATSASPAKGTLRLWKRPAEELRSPAAVKDGGDFLAPSNPDDPDSWYSVADLFGPEGTAIFHLEAVNPISTPNDPTTTVRIVAALANDAAPASLAEDAVRICVANVQIAMDGNRNGQIAFDDPADKQCLFWVNNDHDYMHLNEGMYQEDDGNSPATPNCLDDVIGAGYYDVDSSTFIDMPCKRDLEDFTQLHLQVDATLGLLPDISYHFQFTDVSFGQLEVNLFRAVNGTFDYLQSTTTADLQIKERRILTVSRDESVLGSAVLDLGRRSFFLLEGRQAGKGRLAFIVKSAGVEIARTSLFLDLREIAEFYQRYKVDITHGDHVETTPHQAHGAYTYRPGTDDYILFVHGYNVKEWEVERWTEAMFKRLWWQGYDGHVGMYRWPEMRSPWFNQSEIRAWRSAEGLKRLFERLDSRHPGKVRVLAHSQGNVVVSEAIHLSASNRVHTYIATQAAISAHMFDARLRDHDFAKEFSTIFFGFETPNIYAHYWSGTPATRPYFVETGFRGNVGKTCNFANEQDYALAWWRYNNILKPADDMGYGYSKAIGFYQKLAVGSRRLFFPGNRDEIFSYCAESRSNALGATAFRVQGFDSRYMLQRPPLSYNNHHYSHSRQFRSNIVDEWIYWAEVIDSAQLSRVAQQKP